MTKKPGVPGFFMAVFYGQRIQGRRAQNRILAPARRPCPLRFRFAGRLWLQGIGANGVVGKEV
jgi:hypothetical protein